MEATKRAVCVTAAAGLALAIMAAGAGVSAAAGPRTCSGTLQKPGVLKGTAPKGVVVKGVCAVSAGKARVIGTLSVRSGGVLEAAFGLGHSSLTVTGNLVVGPGAVALLGCKANPNGSGLPCIDDPNPKAPTLTSRTRVSGNLVENAPLGVIVHNSSVGGNLIESGGGGGVSQLMCPTPTSGAFAALMFPVYSDIEDTTVGGNLIVRNLVSCYLGIARNKVRGNMTLSDNLTGDPDGIEVLANHISRNLSCSGNRHPSGSPPGAEPVWDNAESVPGGPYFPRTAPQTNVVHGKRTGQCRLASPTAKGGKRGPGKF